MQCVIPVELENFPPGSYRKSLAGREQGYQSCQISFTRVVRGSPLSNDGDAKSDRLLFVCAGELAVTIGSDTMRVKPNNLIRLPRGLAYVLSNSSANDLLCVDITADSHRANERATEIPQLIANFAGHPPIAESSGFDYTFLANRMNGSANIAVNIARVLPGHRGPDFHIHTFDQFYFVLRGRLVVDVGFEQVVAGPFTLVTLPAGIVHRQGNDGDEPEEHLAIISSEPVAGSPLDYQIAMPRRR